MYRSMVVKLAHVVQDRVGIVESMMCLTSHAERTTKQTHHGTQEIETAFHQEQKMRAYISATHVGSVTAGARGFFLGRRLDREKEHERSACSTRTTFSTHTPCRTHIFLTHFLCVAYRHRVWLKVFAVRMSYLPISPSPFPCFIHSLCCSRKVTSTLRSCLHLPCRTVPDPKARVKHTSA